MYTHINWGGKWEIEESESNYFIVKIIKPPKEWEFMKLIGWEKVMILNNDDHRHYFKRENYANR